jgi:hypothetical protein
VGGSIFDLLRLAGDNIGDRKLIERGLIGPRKR